VKIVQEQIPDVTVYIMGDSSESPQYSEECQTLAEMLGLEKNVIFTGNVDVEDYYPKLDVVVLTSISEAQPLSLLEAMSHGVPVVTSNVGACRELVSGVGDDDKALGPSGIVSNVGNPSQTAQSILKILQNRELWEHMSKAGKERVQRYYSSDAMLGQYRELYESYLASSNGNGK